MSRRRSKLRGSTEPQLLFQRQLGLGDWQQGQLRGDFGGGRTAQRLRLWTALAEGPDLSCKQSHRQLTRLTTPASKDLVPSDLPGHCTRE